MSSRLRNLVAFSVTVTLLAVALWQVTGGDSYTKFRVVETVEREIDADDPLVAAGFYDDAPTTETVTRDAFRFGLLPTPQGLFDRHMASVVTAAAPLWLVTLGVVIWERRRG